MLIKPGIGTKCLGPAASITAQSCSGQDAVVTPQMHVEILTLIVMALGNEACGSLTCH